MSELVTIAIYFLQLSITDARFQTFQARKTWTLKSMNSHTTFQDLYEP